MSDMHHLSRSDDQQKKLVRPLPIGARQAAYKRQVREEFAAEPAILCPNALLTVCNAYLDVADGERLREQAALARSTCWHLSCI